MRLVETIKFWWQVKKRNRALLRMAKTADKTPYDTTKEDVDAWFESNPFAITREELNTYKVRLETRRIAVHIIKEI